MPKRTRLSDAAFRERSQAITQRASAKWRAKQEAAGLVQVLVWMPVEAKDALERAAGVRNKTLSETLTEFLATAPWSKASRPSKQSTPAPAIEGTMPLAVNIDQFDIFGALIPTHDGQPDRATLLNEANQLSQTGLSWKAIADLFNERGWQTDNGGVFRSSNLAREVKKFKGE